MRRDFGVALGALLVLDSLWLGVLMTDFYRRQRAHLARIAGGGLEPSWSVTALVHPVLAAGLAVLILPRARQPVGAPALGAFCCADASRVASRVSRAA